MKQGIIKKKDLKQLLLSDRKNYKVFAPVQNGKDVVLSELSPDQELVLEYSNFKHPPKNLFLPQCEVICTYENEELHDIPLPEDKYIVFGIRPCDTRALILLDMIFGQFGGSKDPYYLRRRENALIISMACSNPSDTCFCTSTGGDPAGTEGCDIIAFNLGASLFFESQSANGESFMQQHSNFFSNVKKSDLTARDKTIELCRKKLHVINMDGLKEKLDRSFDAPVWNSISETCLGCGLCTYLCPTCYCFDITDEKEGEKGRRIRTWDSCQYALFTHHASGHNPRPSQKERMRQRILHKFLYTVDNFEKTFCVGCGRCVQNCPVNLDLRETLKNLQEKVNK